MAKLSPRGLFNYDPTIFDGLNVPQGVSKGVVVDTILIESADLEVLYPHPDTFREAVALWSSAMLPSWERMNRALSEEYDPLHNFDRYEDYTDAGTSKSDGKGNSVGKVQGFNSGEMTTADENDTKSETAGEFENKHRGHLYGNIGVTTSAQMIEGEMNVREKYNMIKIIVDGFISKFCLLIY